MISIEEVQKIAELARIELSPAELEKMQGNLTSILDYVAELQSVNTDGLEIVSSVTGLENISREDTATLIDYQEDILANAPEQKDHYYKVKSIL